MHIYLGPPYLNGENRSFPTQGIPGYQLISGIKHIPAKRARECAKKDEAERHRVMQRGQQSAIPPVPEEPEAKSPRGVSAIRGTIRKFSRVLQHMFRVLDDGVKLAEGGGQDDGASDEKAVQKMQEREKVLKRVEVAEPEAVFPVYGVVKSSKSTLMSYLMRESLLPVEAMPMTSIPIKVVHKKLSELKDGKNLTIPFHDRWNEAVRSLRSRLIAGTVDFKFDDKDAGAKLARLKDIAQTIQDGKALVFNARTVGDDKIRAQLYFLSHFVRLIWSARLNLEDDFNIKVETDSLPRIEMSMATFEHLDAQKFAFMDTPGYNEIGATEVLEDLAPKMVSSSSGCIAVVPWNQVDADQMEYFYAHLLKTMKNKTIIVIVSLWDSFGGDEKEKQAISKSVTTRLRGCSNLKMYFTSAKKLEVIWRVQVAIQGSEQKEQPWDGLKKRIEADSNIWPTWIKNFYKGIYNGWGELSDQKLYEQFVGEDGLLRRETDEYKGKEITRCVEGLYRNAAKIALEGYLGSLRGVFEDFQESVEQLKKFATAGMEEKKRIQERLGNLQKVYQAVSTEVKEVPTRTIKRMNTEIKSTMDALLQWARAQDSWHVRRYEEVDGKKKWLPYSQYIQFENLPELNIWFVNVAKPTLLKPLRVKLKEVVSKLPGQLKQIVKSGWRQFETLVEKLRDMGDDVIQDFLAYNVSKTPEIQPPKDVEKRLDFDKKSIPFKYGTTNESETSFTEDTNVATIVLDNEVLKKTILREFENRASQIVKSAASEMETSLREFTDLLDEKVRVHLQTLSEIYERNKQLLEEKLDVDKVNDVVKALEKGETFCETFDEQVEDGLAALGDEI